MRVPGSRSLKEKRKAVAQVRDRLRAKKNFSVAEIGFLDDHVRAVLAVSMVANDQRFVQSALDQAAHEVGTWRAALIENAAVMVFRPRDDLAKSQYDEFIGG